jgi:LPXTG-motif cell wall-anchored protein
MKRITALLVLVTAIFVVAAPATAQSTNSSPCAPGQPPGRPPGTPPGSDGSTPVGRPSMYPPRTECAVRLSNNVGAKGSSVTVSGVGFTAGAPVTISLHSTPVQIGTTTTDASGAFSSVVTIPLDAAAGAHSIVASDGAVVLSASFEVTGAAAASRAVASAAPASSTLPRTGVQTGVLVAVAVGLIGLGALAVIAGRRRLAVAEAR